MRLYLLRVVGGRVKTIIFYGFVAVGLRREDQAMENRSLG
jgi:hypothetical protein